MRLSRDIANQFAREYLIDLNAESAALRCGIIRSPRFFGNALLKRPAVKEAIGREMESRCVRLNIQADFVLSELMRQYVRLTGMLGHDMAMLYDVNGVLMPIIDWPEVWRTRLVSEITTKELFAYSKDGQQTGDSKAWDKIGEIKTIKRETTIAIEREIRATLQMIGQHVNVKAFPVPGEKLGEAIGQLADSINSAIAAGRQRAAQRNRPLVSH